MASKSNTFNTLLFNRQLISLQNYILIKKNYVMALHRRIAFARIGVALKTDIEKNELDIQLYESLNKISFTERQIKQAEHEFINQFNEFLDDFSELSEHYETLLELAKKHQTDNVDLKHLLYSVNWKSINENVDEKINFYKNLKGTLATYFHKDDNQ